jgi:hypothetical protein
MAGKSVPVIDDGYSQHPMVRYVRSLPGTYYLRTEAAEALECAPTLLAYIATKHPDLPLGPSHRATYGGHTLLLYTPERVEEIHAWMVARNRLQGHGRTTTVWTTAEMQDRRRAQARRKSYLRRAKDYQAAGRDEDAALLLAAAKAEDTTLKQDRAERLAQLARKGGKAPRAAKVGGDEA